MSSNGRESTGVSILSRAQPLFVIGCPRSGTTLLARLLNAHPSVLMTNETAVFLMLAKDIAQSRVGIESGLAYGKEYYELWSDHLHQSARDLIESYYEKIRVIENKQELVYWGEKHPHFFECLDLVTRLYPDAVYVYIVRDPRDVACSVSALINVDRTEAMQTLKPALDFYERFAQEIEPRRLLRIRYRDLITDYEWMVRHIFSWLRLECSATVKEAVMAWRYRDSHSSLSDDVQLVDFVSRSMGRWRREFSEPEKRLAAELFMDYLRTYRYPV